MVVSITEHGTIKQSKVIDHIKVDNGVTTKLNGLLTQDSVSGIGTFHFVETDENGNEVNRGVVQGKISDFSNPLFDLEYGHIIDTTAYTFKSHTGKIFNLTDNGLEAVN